MHSSDDCKNFEYVLSRVPAPMAAPHMWLYLYQIFLTGLVGGAQVIIEFSWVFILGAGFGIGATMFFTQGFALHALYVATLDALRSLVACGAGPVFRYIALNDTIPYTLDQCIKAYYAH